MKEEMSIGRRLVSINCKDKHSSEVLEFFLDVLESFEEDVEELMDRCGIPEEVDLNFSLGNKTLDGLYHVQKKEVSDYLVAIDIFTRHLQQAKDDNERRGLMKNLLETFLHELIHHKYSDEKKTDMAAKRIVRKILKGA